MGKGIQNVKNQSRIPYTNVSQKFTKSPEEDVCLVTVQNKQIRLQNKSAVCV